MKKVARVEILAGYSKLGSKVPIQKGDLQLCATYDNGRPRGWILTWESITHFHYGSPAGGLRGPVIRKN